MTYVVRASEHEVYECAIVMIIMIIIVVVCLLLCVLIAGHCACNQ